MTNLAARRKFSVLTSERQCASGGPLICTTPNLLNTDECARYSKYVAVVEGLLVAHLRADDHRGKKARPQSSPVAVAAVNVCRFMALMFYLFLLFLNFHIFFSVFCTYKLVHILQQPSPDFLGGIR